MYEIFEKLCKLRGITTYRFCKDNGVNASTISTWKKNNSLAGPDLSKKVCEYFNISLDYLMTGKETEEEKSSNFDSSFIENSPYKEEILAIAKCLDEFDNKNDLEFVRNLVEKMSNK